jgi:signal transduction histidine kinase
MAAGLADALAIEEERRRAESLAELDRAKTAFFSNVSHEFRTPLTLMLGPLEELLRHPPGTFPREAVDAVSTAHRNSLRLLKLVNTLLDFSRLEAGRVDASFEPTDLAALTAELAGVFRSATDKAGVRLVVECPPLPEPVHVDLDMWEKIVLNLLSNALKFTRAGEIRVTLAWEDGHATLRVADTGIGIPAADLPRMFQRFHRVKQGDGRTHEGTGIGLALVRELTAIHGGTATVESREGHGSVFSVTIPGGTEHLPPERVAAARQLTSTSVGAQPFVEEALRWLPAHADPAAVSDGTARARLLVADDNADMRDYLARLLTPYYQVETVADGRAALDRIEAHPPDLVLADVMMPVLDGFGLVAAIRANVAVRSLPIILLSARAGEGAQIEGLESGADQYLVKPFSARDLLARVASQLALVRLRRGAELTIAESERQLREADARKDEFLALLAHELRNPLAPIRTGLELIRLSGDAPETVRRVRSMIERQVTLMVRLIDDLLDVSRITSGKIVLQRRPTALAELVQSAVEAQRAAIEAAEIALTIQLPPQACVVDVDPARVVQIISNILHNASKFTPAGGRISLSVEVERATPGGRCAAIRVADTGIGIAPALLGRIFDLFTQGDALSERAQGGLGLGLALARRLTEMHGGDVAAYSDGPGRGSEFVVRLPLSKAAPEIDHPPMMNAPRVRSRALIIDDNRDAATTMSMFVEELGGVAVTAHDGTSGLAAMESFQPDIVFMDIGMPGLDGYEVCRRIRQLPSQRQVVLVAVTGWGQAHDKRRAIEAGFDAHLTKPVDPDAVAQLLAGAAV